MGSPTAPTHGKHAAVYALRPNGFKGAGLNDVTWGVAFSGAATAYYEVVIDHIGANDSYKWRKNGGAWTEDVAFVGGVEETLDEGQKLTFAAHTGHTVGDQWVIGNLKAEATTESGAQAQITAAANRILNPNAVPIFTDSGGKIVETIDFTQGKAIFSGNVTAVTVAGNNGYIPLAALQKVGYLFNWQFQPGVDIVEVNRCGQDWKEVIAGQGQGSGGADAYFIGTETMFNIVKDVINNGRYAFLQLFNYDLDQDQTGDHFNAWVIFDKWSLGAPIGDAVKENITFKLHGTPSFTADA
jgi:hypothetical protein